MTAVKLDKSGFTDITSLTGKTLELAIPGAHLKKHVRIFYNILYNFSTVIDMLEGKELFTTSTSDFIYTAFVRGIIDIKSDSEAAKLTGEDDEQVNALLNTFVEIYVPKVKELAYTKGTKTEEIKDYLSLQGDNMTEVERLFRENQARKETNSIGMSTNPHVNSTDPIDDEDLDEDEWYIEQGYVDVTDAFNAIIRSTGYFVIRGLYDIFYHPAEDMYIIHVLAEGDTKVTETEDILDALITLGTLNALYTDKDDLEDDSAIIIIKLKKLIRTIKRKHKEDTQ